MLFILRQPFIFTFELKTKLGMHSICCITYKLVRQELPFYYFLPYLHRLKRYPMINTSNPFIIKVLKYAFSINNALNQNRIKSFVDTSNPFIIKVLKYAFSINDALNQNRIKSFVVVIGLWIYFWNNDGYITSINCTKYKENPI
jgi:hypothetical protein